MSFIFEHSEIISVVLALIFGLTSIIGKTWDENISKRLKLTKLGYIMGSVFFLLLIFSVSAAVYSKEQAGEAEKRMKEINARTKDLLDSLQVASSQTKAILGTLGEVQKESMSLKDDLAESATVLEGHVTKSVGEAKSALEGHVTKSVGEAKSALEGHVTDAVGDSEGRITSATGDSEGRITSAVGDSEGRITSATGDSEGRITSAVGDSEGRITSAVGGTKSELKKHISDSFSSQKKDVEKIAKDVQAIRGLIDSLGNKYLPKVARFLSQRDN